MVEHALGDGAEIFDRPGYIGGIAYSEDTSFKVIVSLGHAIEGAGHNPIIESITHYFTKYRPNPEREIELISYAERGGMMSYEPITLRMGIIERLDETWASQETLVTLANGAFAENGYGAMDHDAEAFVRDTDERFRACNLMM